VHLITLLISSVLVGHRAVWIFEIVMIVRLFYPPGQGICKCTRDIYHEKLRNGFIKIIE